MTAVLAMTDRLALGVLAAARERGVNVPVELSIIGFDDIDGAAHARPSLTTIRQPLQLKGYAAVRFLLNSPDTASESEILDLPVELVVRHSTGPRH